jgi:hypothetical protein
MLRTTIRELMSLDAPLYQIATDAGSRGKRFSGSWSRGVEQLCRALGLRLVGPERGGG